MFPTFPPSAGVRSHHKFMQAGLLATALIGSSIASAQTQSDAGDRKHRTVAVTVTKGACDIERMSVSAGETVRFVLHNASNLPRDFTVETALMQPGRAMQTSKLTNAPPVEDVPEIVLIPPGETREVVRTFSETKDVELACNVPDHYEFGVAASPKIAVSDDENVVRVSSEPSDGERAPLPEPDLPKSTKLTDSGEHNQNADGPVAARTAPVEATVALVVPPVRPQTKPARRAVGPRVKEAGPVEVMQLGEHDGPGWLVQVSAHRDATSAQSDWIRLVRRHGTLLGSREHFVIRADLGARGIFYRVRVPGFATHEEARDLCAALKARGDGCFLIAPARTASGTVELKPKQVSAEQPDAAAAPRRVTRPPSDLR